MTVNDLGESGMAPKGRDAVDGLLAEWQRAGIQLDPLTEGLVARIVRLSRHFRSFLDESAAPHNMSAEEWEAMSVLRRTQMSGDATPGRLARDLLLTPAAATARIDRLERKGFVRRTPHPTDRRAVRLELTPAGDDAWHQAAGVQQERERLVVNHLTAAQRKHLNNLLRHLTLAAESQQALGSTRDVPLRPRQTTHSPMSHDDQLSTQSSREAR
jgi:DNA-binding MarR family transcriptional regulator